MGALAPQLERQFHIGNTQLGLLVTASSLVGILATLPMGMLADRVRRVRVVTVAIVCWTAATVLTSLATSYLMLLVSRLALGMLVAAAAPAVASLTGDYFAPDQRSRVYGYLLSGELLGSGGGLLLSGNIGNAAGWRVGFAVLVPLGLGLAFAVHRFLPEPPRAGSGVDRTVGEPEQPDTRRADLTSRIAGEARRRDDVPTARAPRPPADPTRVSLLTAARYVLSVPSNRAFIATSALGYFFLGGVRSFAVIFAKRHFGLTQSTVSLLSVLIGAGAIAGTLVAGRLADELIAKGKPDARVVLAGVSFLVAPLLFIPGLVSTSILLSMPLLMAGAAFIAAANPVLDSARLDVVPPGLWGRAESVRTLVRTTFESFAPLLFGYVSTLFGASAVGFEAGVNSAHTAASAGNSDGVELTFLVMLAPLALGGLVLLRRRNSYLADVAAATGDPGRRAPAYPSGEAGRDDEDQQRHDQGEGQQECERRLD